MLRISLYIFWKYKKNIRRDFISPWGRSAFCKLKIGNYHKKSVSHLLNRRLCQTVSQINSVLGETHDSPGLFQFLADFLKAEASVPWPMAKDCDCESFIGLASFPLKICFPILLEASFLICPAATEPISRVLSWTAIYLGRALPPLLDAT